MSKFKAMKFWIGDDPKCSERVQKMLFDMGYGWSSRLDQGIAHVNQPCIHTHVDGSIMYDSSVQTLERFEENYTWSGYEEINIDWLRTPKGEEYVELNGKKYIKEELAEALKHINPVD